MSSAPVQKVEDGEEASIVATVRDVTLTHGHLLDDGRYRFEL